MKTSRPSGASAREIALDIVAADHVEHDIDAAPAGRVLHHLDEILVLVVDAAGGAQRLAGVAFLGGCRRWRRSAGRRTRWASWIAVVPMPLEPPWISTPSPAASRPRSNTLCQTVKKVSGSAAASTMREALAAPAGIAARARRSKSHSRRRVTSAHTASPTLKRSDAEPDRDDPARDFEAGNVGRARRRRVLALALQDVGAVDARRLDRDQHLARARDRHRPLGQVQHLGPARARRSRWR